MAIDNTLYTTATLLGTMRDLEPPSNYWLDLCFPQTVSFDDEWIEFEKITNQRKLAPLVVPMAQGKPIYSEASAVARVKPAYVKPKDPVSITRIIKRRPGQLLGQPATSPQQRYNAVVADIMRAHREAIERRWEWLASQAIQNGSVVLEDEAYPETTIDFNRAAGHTVVKGINTRWGDAGVSILSDIESWRATMRLAKFGGATNRITIGASVWAVMRANTEIKDLMKLDFRNFNNGLNLNLGLRDGNGPNEAEYVGTLSGTLQVWVYSDYYTGTSGEVIPFMDPRDIVLTGPNINGVRCYGAILDQAAGFRALPIFPKMWNQEDPSVTFIMSQSAPLMVPVNPNNTFRARVLA